MGAEKKPPTLLGALTTGATLIGSNAMIAAGTIYGATGIGAVVGTAALATIGSKAAKNRVRHTPKSFAGSADKSLLRGSGTKSSAPKTRKAAGARTAAGSAKRSSPLNGAKTAKGIKPLAKTTGACKAQSRGSPAQTRNPGARTGPVARAKKLAPTARGSQTGKTRSPAKSLAATAAKPLGATKPAKRLGRHAIRAVKSITAHPKFRFWLQIPKPKPETYERTTPARPERKLYQAVTTSQTRNTDMSQEIVHSGLPNMFPNLIESINTELGRVQFPTEGGGRYIMNFNESIALVLDAMGENLLRLSRQAQDAKPLETSFHQFLSSAAAAQAGNAQFFKDGAIAYISINGDRIGQMNSGNSTFDASLNRL